MVVDKEPTVNKSPTEVTSLRLLAPDAYDLILSELERNSPKDRDDVEYLGKTPQPPRRIVAQTLPKAIAHVPQQ